MRVLDLHWCIAMDELRWPRADVCTSSWCCWIVPEFRCKPGGVAAGDLKILAGGHSFSGRMTSLAAVEEPIAHVRGLVLVAFPLRPSNKPASDRAEQLRDVSLPMLFLSGTRANRILLLP